VTDDPLNIEQLDSASVGLIKRQAAQSARSQHQSCVALGEFQQSVFEYFTCFTFAAKGFALVRESLPGAISPMQSLFIGNGPRIRVSRSPKFVLPTRMLISLKMGSSLTLSRKR